MIIEVDFKSHNFFKNLVTYSTVAYIFFCAVRGLHIFFNAKNLETFLSKNKQNVGVIALIRKGKYLRIITPNPLFSQYFSNKFFQRKLTNKKNHNFSAINL